MTAVRAVGRALAAVALTAIGLVVVALPWAIQRVVRFDPLHDRPGWVRRRRARGRATSAHLRDPRVRQPSVRRQVLGAVAGVVVLGLLLGLTPPGRAAVSSVWGTKDQVANPFELAVTGPTAQEPEELRDPVDPDLTAYEPSVTRPAAVLEQDWWFDPYYSAAQGWALSPQGAWQPENPYRLRDFKSRYVNVIDGRRATFVPPPCGCEPLTVWVYGGSTTWGLDQRDEHTIPAEIGRIAWEHGITVDVQNRGQMGQLQWMEGERFAWDVTKEDPPDVVVFYDGVNDAWSTNTLNDVDSHDFRPVLDPTMIDVWNATKRSDGPVPEGPTGSKLIGRSRDGQIYDRAGFADVLVDRYDRSRLVAKSTAEAHGIDQFFFWQPNRYTRPIQLEEGHGNAQDENALRLNEQLNRERLPDDVIDLGDVLDDEPGPLFTDDVHHNERAARVIAESIYEHIEDALVAAQERQDAEGS